MVEAERILSLEFLFRVFDIGMKSIKSCLMSEKNKEMLSQLMKKQISEKSSKKISAAKSPSNAKNSQAAAATGDADKKEDQDSGEEQTEEEILEEAKKASRGKAAEFDQSEMIKKMIIENIVKYTIIIALLVTFAIGLIKFGPAILAFFNGLLYKMMMAALGGK